MRTFVELVERYIDPEFCPYPEYKDKPYYSIKYIENGEEHVGYSTYSLQVMSEFLKKYFISPALEKQEQFNAQNVNSMHRSRPNVLESLNILERAKDDKGCVPMSLVRQAFRNILEQDRWILVTERLPEECEEVNITWINTEPAVYYEDIKNKPFTGTGLYCRGRWHSYSAVCKDYLEERGMSPCDEMDDAIKVTAWRPLPEPYTEEEA